MTKNLRKEIHTLTHPFPGVLRCAGRVALLCFALTAVVPAAAQWRVGVTAGYSYNKLCMDTGYAYDLRYEERGGFTVGIPVQYDIFDWLGVRAEVVFVQKGHKMYRTDIFQKMYTDTRNNYLQVPVMAQFSFGGQRVRGFLNAGGYIGGWVSSHRKGTAWRWFGDEEGDDSGMITPGNIYEFDEKAPFDSRRDNRFEAGLAGGIGVSCRVTPRLSVEVEGRCYYALTDMQKDYMKFRTPRYNTTFVIQAGCNVLLGKIKK